MFSDIIPVYSSEENSNSKNSHPVDQTHQIVHVSKTFIICAVSIVHSAFSNFTYQGYLFICALLHQILIIPDRVFDCKNRTNQIIHILLTKKGREFWLLESKINTLHSIASLRSVIFNMFNTLKCMYLSVIVFASLGCLYILPILSNQNNTKTSLLQRYIQDNSIITIANTKVSESGLASFDANKISTTTTKIQKIALHEVKQGETRESISELYGLNLATVIFNNNLNSELQPSQKLYLPWLDGYIYSNQEDTTPEKIEELYGINKAQVVDENSGNYDNASNLFHKDTLILIPTIDFEKVLQINTAESNKKKAKEDEEAKNRQMELEKSRTLNLASQAIVITPKNLNTNIQSENKMIWPTTGSISRCYSSYHKGCDIANFSAPAIVAAKSGIVSQVSRYQVVGYGLMVKIRHGNGQETLYAHMQNIYVQEGQSVSQGQAIGQMGSTGYSTGTHLHFEVVENGVQVDPLPYLP